MFDRLAFAAILAGYILVATLSLLLVWTGALPGWTVSVVSWLIGAVFLFGAISYLPNLVTDLLEESSSHTRERSLSFIAVFAGLPILGLIILQTRFAAPRVEPLNDEHRYGAIIDAGSGGSRLAIFKWRFTKNGEINVQQVTTVTEKDVDRKDCPLAKIEEAYRTTCDCLVDVVATGRKNAARETGRSDAQPIPLWVKATAGVRALGADRTRKYNIARQGRVLEAADRCLAKVPGYQWRGADVITGPEEGLYAWLAVNYLSGTLHGSALDSVGIVEVGGQSAQIAFRVPGRTSPTPSNGEAVLTVPFASGTLHVYSRSDDELGKGAAEREIKKLSPRAKCTLDTEPSDCIQRIDKFLCGPAPGSSKPCDKRKPAILPARELLFAGLSNFSYIVGNLGLSKANLEEVRAKANEICGKNKDAAAREEAIKKAGEYKEDVCRDAFYLIELAGTAWGLQLESVAPPAARGAAHADWHLGAMIVEALRSRN